MGEIINFEQDFKYYIKQAIYISYEGDYPLAFTYLNYAESFAACEEELCEVYIEKARLYTEIGRYTKSNDMYFKVLAKGVQLPEAYFGLVQNYYCLNNMMLVDYYLKKMAEADENMTEMEFELMSDLTKLPDLIEESKKESKYEGYEILYPKKEKKEIDLREEKARELIIFGNHQEAIEQLIKITEDKANYEKAMDELIFCYFMEDRNEEANELVDKLYEINKNSIINICNKLSLEKQRGNLEFVESLSKTLDKLKDLTDEELTRIATTMCQVKDHFRSIKYLEKVLNNNHYSENIMILLGIANYNEKRFSEAIKIFNEAYKINNSSYTLRYFFNIMKKGKERYLSGKSCDELAYSSKMSKKIVMRKMSAIKKMVEEKTMIKIGDKNSKEREVFDWALSLDDDALATVLIENLYYVNFKGKKEILEKLLIKSKLGVGVILKSKAIAALILSGETDFVFVSEGKIFHHKIVVPKSLEKAPKFIKEGMAIAYGVLVLVGNGNYQEMIDSVELLYDRYKNSKKRLTSESAFAAMLCATFNTNKSVTLDDFLLIFNTKVEMYKKYNEFFFENTI